MVEIINIAGIAVGILSVIKKVKGSILMLIFWVFEMATLEVELHTNWDIPSSIISSINFIILIVWLLWMNIKEGIK